ncbi:MAG: hypothetical protein QNJ40_00020 [Xanthomonadales bacterium]|nr:hypothetical protein [Xanthomonadales bacterium]
MRIILPSIRLIWPLDIGDANWFAARRVKPELRRPLPAQKKRRVGPASDVSTRAFLNIYRLLKAAIQFDAEGKVAEIDVAIVVTTAGGEGEASGASVLKRNAVIELDSPAVRRAKRRQCAYAGG